MQFKRRRSVPRFGNRVCFTPRYSYYLRSIDSHSFTLFSILWLQWARFRSQCTRRCSRCRAARRSPTGSSRNRPATRVALRGTCLFNLWYSFISAFLLSPHYSSCAVASAWRWRATRCRCWFRATAWCPRHALVAVSASATTRGVASTASSRSSLHWSASVSNDIPGALF